MNEQKKATGKNVSAVWTRSKKSGAEMIELQFETAEHGRLYTYCNFGSESQEEQAMKTLDACGIDIRDVRPSGREVELVLKTEEYNGETKWKIRFVNPLSRSEPLAAERAKSIAQRMYAKYKAKAATNNDDNEEVPF